MPPKAKGTSSGLKELSLSLSKAELVKRLKVCVCPYHCRWWHRPWWAFEHYGSHSPWLVPEFRAESKAPTECSCKGASVSIGVTCDPEGH